MADPDLSRLPTGSMGWQGFVEWATSTDDRIERFFLELKSDVDLNVKRDRQKVAKFILGSAHRDPKRASKRLGGHAVMILGVSRDSARGIVSFEAKDLEREVIRFAGTDHPGWDYHRVPVTEDRDVIIVVVDPPDGRIWPCLADGDGLADGDVYLRADGETRKATGRELALLLQQRSSDRLPAVEVAFVGEAHVVEIDREALREWVRRKATGLRAKAKRSAHSALRALPELVDRRTQTQFIDEVNRWEKAALADPAGGLENLAARACSAFQVSIRNPTKTFLRDVRIEIEFSVNLIAIEWESRDDEGAALFPDAPVDFGRDTYLSAVGLVDSMLRPSRDRRLRIILKSPAHLVLTMKELLPEEEFLTSSDEIVLASFEGGAFSPTVVARWKLTAGDVHDIIRGECDINQLRADWTDVTTPLRHDGD